MMAKVDCYTSGYFFIVMNVMFYLFVDFECVLYNQAMDLFSSFYNHSY